MKKLSALLFVVALAMATIAPVAGIGGGGNGGGNGGGHGDIRILG